MYSDKKYQNNRPKDDGSSTSLLC